MKQLSFILVLFCCLAVNAQPNRNYGNRPPQHRSTEMVMKAHHGEQFVVYVDGDIINRTPQTYVTFQLPAGMHDIYVVLKRPADKIVMMSFAPQEPREEFSIDYDMQRNILSMTCFTSAIPIADRWVTCSSEDFDGILARLKKASFDDDRMELAKMFLSGSVYFTSQQIKTMAETFSFSKGKVDFLKAAYGNCSDPHNFYQCVDVIPFSSDRKEVMDYIGK